MGEMLNMSAMWERATTRVYLLFGTRTTSSWTGLEDALSFGISASDEVVV